MSRSVAAACSVAAARDVGNPVDLRILHDADHGSWGRVRGVQWAMAKSASVAQHGAFLQGLFTNLSNPKAVIFFGAVFSRFVTPGMGLADQILVVVVLAAVSLAWFGGVAWGLGLPRFADTLRRAGPWIDVVSGAVFLVLATVIIAEGVASL